MNTGSSGRMGNVSSDLSLHHIGILVSDVAMCSEEYVRMGYRICSPVIHDPRQTAYVRFFAMTGNPAYLELVAPDGPTSLLANALKRGGGIHHLCYSTDDITAALRKFRDHGAIVVSEPVPAVAFHNNRIAWLINRDRALIELVERSGDDALDFVLPRQRSHTSNWRRAKDRL